MFIMDGKRAGWLGMAMALGLGGCGGQMSTEVSDDVAPETESTGGVEAEPQGAPGAGADGIAGTEPSSCSVRNDAAFPGSACADLQAVVEHLRLVGTASDGTVSPGASATLDLTLRDVSGLGFYAYPGVVVESDHPDVQVQDSYGWLYALLPCEGARLAIPVQFPEPLAPGTLVRFTARADVVQHSPCIGTHAATLSVRID